MLTLNTSPVLILKYVRTRILAMCAVLLVALPPVAAIMFPLLALVLMIVQPASSLELKGGIDMQVSSSSGGAIITPTDVFQTSPSVYQEVLLRGKTCFVPYNGEDCKDWENWHQRVTAEI